MKKKGFIAGALALSLVLGGTGYAYWTDALHITTTATTGDLDVKFVDLGYLAQYDNEDIGWAITDGTEVGTVFANQIVKTSKNGKYNDVGKVTYNTNPGDPAYSLNNVTFNAALGENIGLEHTIGASKDYPAGTTIASKDIVLDVNTIFPGYAQMFRSDIVNDGEIAAKLGSVVGKVKGLDQKEQGNLMDMIGIALYLDSEPEKGKAEDLNNHANDVFGLASVFETDDIFTIGGVDFVRLSAFTNPDKQAAIDAAIEENEKLLALGYKSPFQRFDVYVGVGMDQDAEGKYTTGTVDLAKTGKEDIDAYSENKGLQIVIDFFWKQYNNSGNEFPVDPNLAARGNR